MNGERVGEWEVAANATHRFRYDDTWFASSLFRPLSLSLPTVIGGTVVGEAVAAYFENLLPDRDELRTAMRDRAGLASSSAFDLLAHYGRDCVGAISLLPPGEEAERPGPPRGEALDEHAVAALLRDTANAPTMASGELRLSLAGAQAKTALTRVDGRWLRPLGLTPTTHILKLPMGVVGGNPPVAFDASVDNEHLCALLMKALGFEVATTDIARFEDQRVLVVERFDRRRLDDGTLLRLPQEDLCQALGIPRSRKYESDGGPGMAAINGLLRFSSAGMLDQRLFLRAHLVFWLLAAPDAHAKNFSLRIEAGGSYRLAPLYDILSVYPVAGHGAGLFDPQRVRMAMAPPGTTNRHFRFREILPRHWQAAADALGLPFNVGDELQRLADEAPSVVDTVVATLPPDIHGLTVERLTRCFVAATRKAAEGRPLTGVFND